MLESDLFQILSSSKLFISILFISIIYLVKIYIIKLIRLRSKAKRQDKRHLINLIRNLINLSVVICLFSYWSEELQHFALSIAAFVVAIVIATREFIQCIIGFIYISVARPFQIGDWIQVGSYCGEVTETDWSKLTLLEVDVHSYSHTGKTLFLPNNMLFSSTMKNLNFLKRYATHTFTITRDQSVNLFSIKDELLDKAIEHCEDFYDVAIRYNTLIEKRLDVTISGPAPTIHISTTDIGKNKATVTIFCPSEQALELEEKITEDFMSLWYLEKAKNPGGKEIECDDETL
ncbi:mechanosensitive ion channel family protein [Motiliproteus sp.]|uniref:mechanosensitive ion channel family protein n=1 Tax=Motiliproteus sp. TaxID=1898955 RepID=UPI003BA8D637